jgi:hypothetical protein
MKATKQDVLAVAPESQFATLTDQQWTDAFRLCSPFQNDAAWGTDERAVMAGALFVAHHLALMYPSKAGPGGATITSKSVGGVSISYAAPSVDKDVLALTRWGIILLRLRKSIPKIMVI